MFNATLGVNIVMITELRVYWVKSEENMKEKHKILCSSVYDLRPEIKVIRATFCSYLLYEIYNTKRLIFIRELG